jgi:hypothetical protein
VIGARRPRKVEARRRDTFAQALGEPSALPDLGSSPAGVSAGVALLRARINQSRLKLRARLDADQYALASSALPSA